jgi:HK97 family phage prohead protease
MTLRSAAFEATIAARSAAERTVEIRALPWDTLGETPDGPEVWRRGAFEGTDPERVTLEAIGPHGADPGVRLVGRGIEINDREDGLYATFRVSATRDGDELLELARDRVYRGASIVFAPIAERAAAGGVTERTRAELVRVGIVERPSFAGAEVLAVRSEDAPPMPPENGAQDPAHENSTPAPIADAGLRVAVDSPEFEQRLDALRSDLIARMTSIEAMTGRAGAPGLLARWASFGEYLRDASADPEVSVLLARALADQKMATNPGVAGTSFLNDVKGILDTSRPAIEALGGAGPLGASGMSLNWPYFAGDLAALVGKQTAEKTEITSVVVNLLAGTSPIETFAGGSDISYQLIRRSQPSYLEAYGRIMLSAWALTTEREFEDDIEAGATGTHTASIADDAAIREAFFSASAKVRAATGAPASVVLAASDVFGALGGALTPVAYGVSNQTGTSDAGALRVNVSGLEVVEAPYFTAGVAIFTNGRAARWHEDGPFVATAEDVAKLGQNRAYWSMGATGIYIPAGLVKATGVVVPLAEGRGGRKAQS